MTIHFDGFSSIFIFALVSLFIALPVKFSASVLGAENNSILSSFLAIFCPLPMAIIIAQFSHAAAFLSFPVILIISVMFFLRVGLLGSIGITATSVAIYYGVFTKLLAGINVS